jgi:hypothetical protein
MRKRLLSIFLALLVVSAGFAPPASAASMTDSQCSGLAEWIRNAVTLGLTGMTTSECSTQNDAIDEMKASDQNQTHTDIYNAAAAHEGNSEVFEAVYGNYANDSQSAAWMKMQVAVAEAYEDGKSQTEAKVAAQEAISDYYTVKQINLIEKWNSSATQFVYLREAGLNESIAGATIYYYDAYDDSYQDGVTLGEQSMTLANGSTHGVTSVNHQNIKKSSAIAYQTPSSGELNWADSGNGAYYQDSSGLYVTPPDSIDADNIAIIHYDDYKERWDRTETLTNELQSEANNFVEATYADFDSGEANASDVISANTAMFEYGTEHNENSSLYDSTAALTLMGFDTPNMSSSGTMDVTYNGNTWTGIVLARNAPGGSWQTGTTYNTSNITGPVFLATTDGQKVDFAEGETFSIDQMRSKSGENVTQVNTTKYVYKTANTSELNAMQMELIELRKEIESREPDGGGGGGFGGNSQTVIAIAALAGAALLLGRGGN